MYSLIVLIVIVIFMPVIQASDFIPSTKISNQTNSIRPITDNLETLTGIISNKPWQKTYESYGTGGSDYFVLTYDDNLSITLKPISPKEEKLFTDLINQPVVVTGYQQTKLVSPTDRSFNNNIPSQTLNESVNCTAFIVQQIKVKQ